MKVGRRTGTNLTKLQAEKWRRYDGPFWLFRPIASGEARRNVRGA